ncbi:MAG: hypothetical protein HY736_25325 [Verrucomicrobia bacterium]|nr:hypothetical protein [Verrucomicrobiota bacterium]
MPDQPGEDQRNRRTRHCTQATMPAPAQLAIHLSQDIAHRAGLDDPIRWMQL